MTTVTFTDSGTFTVPIGVTQLNVSVIGGSGGSIPDSGGYIGYGGYGGKVESQLTVQSGTILDITVGKKGENAFSSTSGSFSAGGGGSSAISYSGQIYLIAGGGGGAAGGYNNFSSNGGNACNGNTSIGGNGYGYGGSGGGFGGGNGIGGNGGGTITLGDNGYNGFGGNGGDGYGIGLPKGGTGFVSTSTNGFGGNGYRSNTGYGFSGGGGGGGYGGGGGGGNDGSGQSSCGGGGAGGSYANPDFTSNVTFAPYTSRTDGTVIITYVPPEPVPCLLSTCSILTSESYKPITEIKAGDSLISAFSKQPKKVLHCGYKTVDLKMLESSNHPMVIPKNHFKEGIPSRDVYISGHHRVICPNTENNYMAIQTFKLGNFKTLTNEEVLDITGQDEVRYYHIEVEGGKDAMFCDGLPIETLDAGEWPSHNIEN